MFKWVKGSSLTEGGVWMVERRRGRESTQWRRTKFDSKKFTFSTLLETGRLQRKDKRFFIQFAIITLLLTWNAVDWMYYRPWVKVLIRDPFNEGLYYCGQTGPRRPWKQHNTLTDAYCNHASTTWTLYCFYEDRFMRFSFKAAGSLVLFCK